MEKVSIVAESQDGSVSVRFSDKPILMLDDEYEQKLFDCAVGVICETAMKLAGSPEEAREVSLGMIKEARQKFLAREDSKV